MVLEAVGRGEAAFEERGPVDVVVLRAGEDEVLSGQPLGGGTVLGEVAVEEGPDGFSGRAYYPIGVAGHHRLRPPPRPDHREAEGGRDRSNATVSAGALGTP